VFTDIGVSVKDNVIEGEGWLALMATIAAGDRVVVTSQSRLGRRNYEVLYAVGKLIEGGASLKVLDEDKVYDDLDNFEQNLNLTFRSINDHTERVETSRWTTQALSYLSSNGVKLGPKPKLTDADVERVRVLRDGGLGVRAISRTVRKEDKDGRLKPISANTVKRVLAGGLPSARGLACSQRQGKGQAWAAYAKR
jgi:DNA invertase Pin-like site-specific DNA recombinase